jgi:hypothetical protein
MENEDEASSAFYIDDQKQTSNRYEREGEERGETEEKTLTSEREKGRRVRDGTEGHVYALSPRKKIDHRKRSSR